MRAQYPFATFLFAAALLAACDMSTSPEPLPDESEPAVLTVAPSFATIGGQRSYPDRRSECRRRW